MFALVTLWEAEGAALAELQVESIPKKVRFSNEIVWTSSPQFYSKVAHTDLVVERAMTISVGTAQIAHINREKLYHLVLRLPVRGE